MWLTDKEVDYKHEMVFLAGPPPSLESSAAAAKQRYAATIPR
jgi:hypothetical protein